MAPRAGDAGGPVSRRAFLALFGLALLVRLALATLPGYAADLDWYRSWALAAARHGLAGAYEAANVDYPPVLLYPMWVVGKLYLAADPALTLDDARRSAWMIALIKSPQLVADLALAWLLFVLVARGGTWGTARAGPAWGRLAALTYLWNPAVLWDSGYWGQPDSVHSLFVVAALVLALRDRPGWGGASMATAVLTKPLAVPLVPLLLWLAFARGRWLGLARTAGGAAAAVVVIFLPFVVTGRIVPVLTKIVGDVESMPFTSVNAHNLWWLLGPWRDANVAVLGPLSAKWIAIVLFLAAYTALLLRLQRRDPTPAPAGSPAAGGILLAAAAVSAAFFFLSTHMHENHLFLALPLLLAVAGGAPARARLAAICTVAMLANMVLHDPLVPYRLPGLLGAESPVLDPFLGRPYTWLQWVGSYLNTLLVGFLAVCCYRAAWKGVA